MLRADRAPALRVALFAFSIVSFFFVTAAHAQQPRASYPPPSSSPVNAKEVFIDRAADGSTMNVNSGDTAWVLVSAGLVLMMTAPGLALFYGGLVRRKNVLATMMQSFILMGIVSVLWAIIGYSLAFDACCPFIGGLRFAFLREVGFTPAEYAPTIPHSTFMVYQCMFAIITPALISGAYAER